LEDEASVESGDAQPTSGGRRRAEPTGVVRSLVARLTSGNVVRFDSWFGALWVVVIGLDFFWMSNPTVLIPFDEALHKACVATAIAVVATLPRFQLPRPSWAVVGILSFGFASALWSSAPEATVHFTATFLLIATLATVIASIVDARTVIHGVMLGGVLVLGGSWYALHEKLPMADVPVGATGYLAGLSGNRNALAFTMVLSLTLAISFLPRRWWGRVVWALATGTIVAGVYLTESGTGYAASLILVVAAGVLLVIDGRRRREAPSVRRRLSVAALAVLAVVGGAFVVDLLGRALGRDVTTVATLTGRTPLWQAVWSSTTGIDRWFGSGWGTVWPHQWNPAPRSDAYREIIDRTGYVLYHGHSSFFDLLPEIGIVGVVLYALTYVHATLRAFRLRDPRRGPTPARLIASRATLLGVLGLLLLGVTEPMSTVPLGWFMAVLLATGLVPTSAVSAGRRAAPGRRRGPVRRPPR